MLELANLVRRDHASRTLAGLVLWAPVSGDSFLGAGGGGGGGGGAAPAAAAAAALGAVLAQARPAPALYFLVSQTIAAHLAQETVVTQLLSYRVGSPQFRERAQYLRQLIVHHADHEAACLQPALPDHLPRPIFRTLATCYAVERARVLDEHHKLACIEPLIARSA